MAGEDKDERKISLLTPRILEIVQKRCYSLSKQDRKAAAKIASYATFYDPDLRYWLEQADHIIGPWSSQSTEELDCEDVANTLMLQNLLNQLSCVPPDDITFCRFQKLLEPVGLTNNYLE